MGCNKMSFAGKGQPLSDEIGTKLRKTARVDAAQAPIARRDFVISPISVQQWDSAFCTAKVAAHGSGEVAEIYLLRWDQLKQPLKGVDKLAQIFGCDSG